ncbi:MAG: D-alanine--D-alanine ligase [Oscillospiraceae bacterium]|nr:D-alanine--D-alanine ligase [Oscillospiraceae bacterium]
MNIVVLCGGLSNERDVSLSTGTGAARALLENGHRVALLDLYLGCPELPDDMEAAFSFSGDAHGAAVGERLPDLAQLKALRPDSAVRVGPNVLTLCRAADIVFLALHGEEGENGKIQAMLDLYGVRYTGSGYLGSVLAMNKGLTKTLLRAHGLAAPEGILLHRGEVPTPGSVRFPCIVKPCSGGSSVGTSIVEGLAAFSTALETAFQYEEQVIVERYIRGRELTVGVMDGSAMPVIEIIPRRGFYDYRNKYQPGATEELCPAPIGTAATARAQHIAEQVRAALQIDAYCRVDLLWDTEWDEMFCLEANTLPGMTPTSLIPRMAAAEGMSYAALCEKIIAVSMKKYLEA